MPALLILGLILFVGLVVVHEWGHFIMARRNGVEVEEFGIGFPPTIWSKKVKSPKGDFEFTLNALPLGGFVRLKGENDEDKSPGSFGAATTLSKIKIMVAGVVMNLFTAFAMLTLLAIIGIPRLLDNQFTIASDTEIVKQTVLINYIEPDSPASNGGLEARDQLVSIGSAGKSAEMITSQSQLPEVTKKLAGSSVNITVLRNGETMMLDTTLRSTDEVEASKASDEPKGYLGIIPTEFVVQRSTWTAPIVAVGLIKQMTELTLKGLGSALSGVVQRDGAKASEQVSGPVGIYVILRDGSVLGFQFVLMIVAVISLTLAIMNALPIPALDGGRLFVTLLFRAMNKPLRKRTEELIHGTGFIALMGLFVLITIVDVKRFF